VYFGQWPYSASLHRQYVESDNMYRITSSSLQKASSMAFPTVYSFWGLLLSFPKFLSLFTKVYQWQMWELVFRENANWYFVQCFAKQRRLTKPWNVMEWLYLVSYLLSRFCNCKLLCCFKVKRSEVKIIRSTCVRRVWNWLVPEEWTDVESSICHIFYQVLITVLTHILFVTFFSLCSVCR